MTLPGDAVVYIRHGYILVCTSKLRPGYFLTITTPKIHLSAYAEDDTQCHEFITRIRKFADIFD